MYRKPSLCNMVGMTGLEPATPCPPDKCATRLRHIPKSCFLISVIFYRFFTSLQVLILLNA